MSRARNRFNQAGQRPCGCRKIDKSRALQCQRAVVLCEPFGQPQLPGNIRALEIEWLEPLRPDAFDVPAVEELVRHGVEDPLPVGRNRAGARDHRAVAMLHAVAVGVRQVVGEKGVVPGLVLRILAVNGALLLDDLLHVFHEAVQLGVGARVMQGKAKPAPAHAELAQGDRTELDRAVHEVLQVWRGQDAAVVQLRRDLPLRTGWLFQQHADRPVFETAGPHERGGHVDVRVGCVDREIRAVDAVAEHLVPQRDVAAVPAHGPPIRIRPRRLQLAPVGGEGVHVVDVLREIMERVAAR